MTTPKIQSIIQNFVAELTAALSEASHNAISQALGGGAQSVAVRKGTGRPAKSVARAKRGKRSPDELAKLTQSFLAYVKKNPGQRIEQIGKALGMTTKEFGLPVKKLMSEKKVSTKGAKRATTYFAK